MPAKTLVRSTCGPESHAEDFEAELLRLRPREDRPCDALLPRAHVFERVVFGGLARGTRRSALRQPGQL
jgi:hypothetical protein